MSARMTIAVLLLLGLVGFLTAYTIYHTVVVVKQEEPPIEIPRTIQVVRTVGAYNQQVEESAEWITGESPCFTNEPRVQVKWIGKRVKVTGVVVSVLDVQHPNADDWVVVSIGSRSVLGYLSQDLSAETLKSLQRNAVKVTLEGHVALMTENQVWLTGCRITE